MHTQKEPSQPNAVAKLPPSTFQQAFQLHQQGQLDQAEVLYAELLKAHPQHIDALHFSGVLANQRGQAQRAVDLITRALDIDANNVAAHSNLGLALHDLKRFDDALASYDRALTIKPDNAEAHYNRGNALLALKRLDEALISYDRALTIKPDYAEAFSNRGHALRRLKRYDEALASYERALAISPDCAEALSDCGGTLQDLRRFSEAIVRYDRALAIKPDLDFILGTRLHMKMNICDWREFDHDLNELSKAIERGEKVTIPFAVQSVSSSAALQKKAAEIFIEDKYSSDALLPPLVKHVHSKIRIGYFSSDFRRHALAYLMAELFERHDRSRFEVIAFSFSPTSDKDDMRLRLEAAFDQFIDVSQQSDEHVVQLARELEIDIAVDLNGFTLGGRTGIFAMRAAPIQVNYLGYLGTMDSDYMDYLLADAMLIPTEHQTYYNEKIAYLPHSFQVNDRTLRISDKVFTRAELGLPAQGFVFCCFNNHYKITPAIFASWMRILHQVEGSVLWLIGDNDAAAKNLRLEATARGIDAERMYFAQRLPKSEHLARHRLADLFLDTSPCNAGATASDALWAGLPILTCLGETFSGRMAASLLHAIGLPELITTTLEDYEALAVQLATQPQQLAEIRQKLANNRLIYPLFDTSLFTQHIESAYQAMFDRYQAGLAPEHIYVSARDNFIAPTLHFVHPEPVEGGNSSTLDAEAFPRQSVETMNIATFQHAFQLHQQGQLEQAEALYEELLKQHPQHIDTLHFSGVLANQLGQAQRAVDLISLALDIDANNAAAHSNLGLALHALNRFNDALTSYDHALTIEPNNAEVHFNYGNALLALKRLDEALASYDHALTIKPDYIEALSNRGNVLQDLKRFDEAILNFDHVLAINPNNEEAHYNRGNTLLALKRLDEALASYDHALTIKPDYIEALSNRGIVLRGINRLDEALSNYECILAIKPNDTEAYCNRGDALVALNRCDEAIVSFDRALSIKPDYIAALSSRGIALKYLDRLDEALANYERILIINPDSAEALGSCAIMLQELGRYDEALISYERALAIKPDLEFIFGSWLFLKMKLCDWSDFDNNLNKLAQGIEQGEKISVSFTVQAISSSAALQKKAAEILIAAKHPSAFLLPALVKTAHRKIRIGYFSSDFCHHPVAYLTAELFERHNRSQFEVIAFSFNPANQKDDLRLRLEAAFDQFIDVSQQSDEQVVRLARSIGCDIAINLNGLSGGCRTGIFAMRAAPIQVNYLGYLGTMGADYMDYLLADATLIPIEHQIHYNEKIAYLPHSFQVNDGTLRSADKVLTRAELNLPEQGFVFCCFNNNYKITPIVFANWMRILRQVTGSVLWLLGDHVSTENNLRLTATAHGIDANRLVFAKRVIMPEYLARHRLADLFLDTSPYNAGATASAALWMGLPILTCLGETFSGRMAASLLHAIGLPELITTTLEDYEALAVQLATQPQQLAEIRQKLANNRLIYPLFDTSLFTQHIESAYQAMFDRYQAGLAPEHIYVSARDNFIAPTPHFVHPEPVEGGNSSTLDAEAFPRQSVETMNIATFQHAFQLHQQGQLEQAEALYEELLKQHPQHIDTLHFSGVLANQLGQAQRAVDLISLALNIDANNAAAHSNLGLALHALNRFNDALTSCDRALTIKPDYAEALSNRGMVLRDLHRLDDALSNYESILAINPNSAAAEFCCGVILQDLNRFSEAIVRYDRALAIKPDLDFVLGARLHMKMNICDWREFDHDLNELSKAIERGEKASIPFIVQAVSSSTTLQKKAAYCYAKAKCPSDFLLPPLVKHTHSKIRIGYFSSDFRHHPVAYLTAELFERHDRSRFEAIAFSFSPTSDKDDMRLRLEAAFDQFIDVSQQSDEHAVQLARELEIDIAVDLNGFTENCRPSLFAMRAAPIQVSYLGYLGTMGADYMDYLLADATLIPTEHQAYYSEKIAYLPHSFQVNDSTLRISDKAVTRAEFGLPAQGFVFCCFNNHYKITPAVFASWMRILHQVEGSVLWLVGDNGGAETNLRLAATDQGVDTERLVFAKRVPMPEHLARHRLADLFLDTAPYNAGATASAALWAGLPVLTCLGETFSGRMAAGLLHAIGLPELITTTLESYEALAVQIARQPEYILAIKQKLADNRLTYPLFNTALFTQHIESAFQAMFDRYQAGLASEHIYVQAQALSQQPPQSIDCVSKVTVKNQPTQSKSQSLLAKMVQKPAQIFAGITALTKSRKTKTTPAQKTDDSLTQAEENIFARAQRLHQQGQLAAAEILYGQLLKTQPHHAELLGCFDALKRQRGQTPITADAPQPLSNTNPEQICTPLNEGIELNRLDEALAHDDNAVAINSDAVEALINQGNTLEDLHRLDEALASYDRALSINPDYARAHSNRGNVLQSLKRFDEALASYDRALTIRPDYAEAFYNRGNTLQASRRSQEAIVSYDRALAIKPDFIQALICRGNALHDCRHSADALISYDRALAIQPDGVETLYNRGNVLIDLNRYDDALANYERALVIQPDYAEALVGCGVVLQELKRLDEAFISYKRALAIKPNLDFTFGDWLHIKMKLCNWSEFGNNVNELANRIEQGKKVSSPFPVLALSSSAAVQKKAACCYAQEKYPPNFLLPPLVKHAHSKIRIGYFSSDFCNHPVAHLTAELFERHNRLQFEVIAFSFNPASHKDDMRLRLEAAFDQFMDVSQQSDEQVVRLARQLELDIAVDLNGFTTHARTGLFAMRVAPIQVSYLGYLGTMGADYMDYLLADPTLIPVDHQAYYSEKIAYLPHSFQVNDSKQAIANKEFTRAELGLPEQGFVFCCFNSNYKITPTVFESWMRILHQVEDSVLWLLGDNVSTETNLRLAATAYGINVERICFVKRLAMPEYLARHRLADLFLDTSPYNAGATASAALWAGLPVLTCLGDTFAGRMAASLLYAIGLPELVTQNLEDYEALAVQLATQPEHTLAIKQKLADNRLTYPLFNTIMFTQHIESAYQTMFDRYQAGLAPEHIYVQAQANTAELPSALELPPQSQSSPVNSDKFQQALSLHQQGQLAAAEILYEEILQTEPQHVDALHFLGVLKNQNGQAQLAVDLIQQSLNLYPNNAAAYFNLGAVFQALNRFDEALASYDKALTLTPDDVKMLLSRGSLLLALNRPDEALTSYNRVLAIQSDAIEALLGRGLGLQVLNRLDEALIDYEHLLAIDAHHAKALFGHANVLYKLKRADEAISSYDCSLVINPDSFEALYNRGVALDSLNRVDEAMASYQQALAIKADYVEAHNNLATLLKKQNRYLEAETSYQRALAIKPDYIEAHCNLITLLKDQGRIVDAEANLNAALVAIPDSLELRFIQLIMALPMVTKTTTDSALVPHQFNNALTDLSNWLASSSSHQESLIKAGLLPLPFLLAYRMGNHVKLLSRYGDLVAAPTQHTISVKPAQKKIRMVVVSHHFRRHSVWDVITRGLLVNLDRTRFELILYHLGNIEDQETAFAKSLADEWRDTHTMTDVTEWLTALASDAPDVIFYPEIGMDPLSARLAAHRIAPLQMASWGHPITTGFPNIDLYFSGDKLESPDADAHYRERLIRLPGTGCCTTPINITPEPLLELEAQLVSRRGVRFVIAQTIYKFDPADDALYANIASVVGESTFILLRDRDNAWAMDQIVARLEQTFVDRGLNPKQHLLVIPWQSMEKFQGLLDVCDIYLDCPSFSGYTTAWQAVHRGLPIVTLEGEFMRQRLAAGLLRKIGITDTIASSREQYIQLAAKLAQECRNPALRHARRTSLKTAAPKADNDVSVVRAFEQTVIEALAERAL